MTSRIAEGPVSYNPGRLRRDDNTEMLDDLVKIDPSLWRGRSRDLVAKDVMDSGFEELNAILPAGGWPLKSVIELVVDEWGNGELQVLLPLMCLLSQTTRFVLIAPPYLPYAPALHNAGVALDRMVIVDRKIPAADKWWCAEKLLRHGDCKLVLIWPDPKSYSCGSQTRTNQVRRLQVAATAGNNLGVIFSRGKPGDTPVSLRLKLGYCRDGIAVQVLKSRFSWQRDATIIPRTVFQA